MPITPTFPPQLPRYTVVLCATLLESARAPFPNYFGYSVPTESLFSSVIPLQYQAQPLFGYAVYTRNAATAPVPLASSIYTSPDDTYRGYSYQTEYEGGGKSKVAFVTGPQANQLLQKSMELFRTIVPPEVEQPTGRSLSSNATNNSTAASSATHPTSNSSGTSYYNLQLHPAHTSPFIGFAPPLQNIISSFAYTISNDIASSIKDAFENEEAQESMIHGDVLTPAVPTTSTEVPHSTTSAPQTTSRSPSEETSAAPTTKTTTTTNASTTAAATTTANPEPTTRSKTPAEEANDIADSNTTTQASEEINETTTA
ncbi:hypothetical protein Cfor_03757 [Coptotermes formosanus]|uniref:Uncharacterized protein n=1 Tax=Coptotermes formosanus TaxID=36987 RepID=A0A6L2Q078_COPFO|nr:hypothetical protein Cfor_03757 [Coptotermes formosanus]